jgi:hypothetical protein
MNIVHTGIDSLAQITLETAATRDSMMGPIRFFIVHALIE